MCSISDNYHNKAIAAYGTSLAHTTIISDDYCSDFCANPDSWHHTVRNA